MNIEEHQFGIRLIRHSLVRLPVAQLSISLTNQNLKKLILISTPFNLHPSSKFITQKEQINLQDLKYNKKEYIKHLLPLYFPPKYNIDNFFDHFFYNYVDNLYPTDNIIKKIISTLPHSYISKYYIYGIQDILLSEQHLKLMKQIVPSCNIYQTSGAHFPMLDDNNNFFSILNKITISNSNT